MIFLIGIPIYSLQLILNIRNFINKQLGNHEFCAIPEVPKWKEIHEWNHEPALASINIYFKHLTSDLGFMYLISFNNYTVLMSLNGTFYHIGQSECGNEIGCIALINLSKTQTSNFDCGDITFIDVFSYDGIDYRNYNYVERYKLIKLLPKLFSLPKRYSLKCAELTKNDIFLPNSKTFVLTNSFC